MGFKSLKRKLQRIESELEDTAVDAVADSADDVVFTAKGLIVAQDAVASSELYRGVRKRVLSNQVRIESTAPHSGFVEWGTGMKQSPTAPTTYKAPEYSQGLVREIFEWMLIKPSFPASRVSYVRAHFIAEEISEKGTAPQPFFESAWGAHERQLKRHVRHDIKRLLK